MSKIEINTIDKQDGSTLTLGGSGTAVTLACGATQTGFGRTGTVDWQTGSIKTTTFTAANGEGYFADTSSGAFVMNLPAGTAGNIVSVVDYTNTFQTHNLTITPNGSQKIGGAAASAVLSTEGQSITLVYVDDTEGWKNTQDSTSNLVGKQFVAATGGTVTTVCTNFKVHTFTGPGTFCVSNAGNAAGSNTVDYLVVAGGGGGGKQIAGGGGAGGYRESSGTASGSYSASPLGACVSALPVTATGFPITVGAGAAGATSIPTTSSGSNSIFSSITSAGGGGGIGCGVGANGGSGGGNGKRTTSPVGQGNTPPVTPAQGTNGGQAVCNPGGAGGGGGGATVVGGNSVSPPGGPGCNAGGGGTGATSSITGSPVARAGGGGGGGRSCAGTAGTPAGAASPCGTGGAGTAPNADATAGTTNTGGGGGGTGYNPSPGNDGAAGGSGIVIIRYKFQ